VVELACDDAAPHWLRELKLILEERAPPVCVKGTMTRVDSPGVSPQGGSRRFSGEPPALRTANHPL
jgi:hypothetical protein